ncbi:MAG: hypothetical protein EP330_22645 [Deltaproteobacteria bacterium]|nr:MAG: hypothetical protein EP330_22645 [Deltaproteobacteria bacterium]
MPRLAELARELEARGTDPRVLRELQLELQVLDTPPSLLGRLRQQVRELARRNAERLSGEIAESREMVRIIRRRVAREQVTEDELILVREQMLDLVRVVPAAMVVATNYTLPLPGTSLLTPWLLAKLGLLPTRWREAHILHTLHKEAARLRAAGHTELAERVEALESQVEEEADARTAAAHEAALLTHWDANHDGQWQESELAAYRAEVLRLAGVALRMGTRKRWFLQAEGRIFGPVTLPALQDLQTELPLLVCYDGKSGWVDLRDLLTTAQSTRG